VRRSEASYEMEVIFDAADMDISDTEISSRPGDVGVKVRTDSAVQKWLPAPCRVDYVDID